MSCNSQQIIVIFKNMAETVVCNEQYLNELDSIIGDAEHGLNLKRGFSIILEKIDSFEEMEPAEVVKKIGTVLAGAGCGSGPIFYGLAIRAAGNLFVKEGFETTDKVALGLEAALQAIKEKGGAEVGYKTMIDALEPGVKTFRAKANEGASVVEAFEAAATAARKGMESTINMVGKKGRSFHAGERGTGHQDPGATSAYLLLKSIWETLKTF
jgi:phosphoenolpyruvate---glycerone phosphotransferase subunit DhaL